MTVLRTSVLVAQASSLVALAKAAPVDRTRSPRKRHLPVEPTSLRGKRWATSEDAGATDMTICSDRCPEILSSNAKEIFTFYYEALDMPAVDFEKRNREVLGTVRVAD